MQLFVLKGCIGGCRADIYTHMVESCSFVYRTYCNEGHEGIFPELSTNENKLPDNDNKEK